MGTRDQFGVCLIPPFGTKGTPNLLTKTSSGGAVHVGPSLRAGDAWLFAYAPDRLPVVLAPGWETIGSNGQVCLEFRDPRVLELSIWLAASDRRARERAVDAVLTTHWILTQERTGIRVRVKLRDVRQDARFTGFLEFNRARIDELTCQFSDEEIGERRIHCLYVESIYLGERNGVERSGTGWGIAANERFFALGRTTLDELMVHEIGHLLGHADFIEGTPDHVSPTNVMWLSSKRRHHFDELQIIGFHENPMSCIRAVAKYEPEWPTASPLRTVSGFKIWEHLGAPATGCCSDDVEALLSADDSPAPTNPALWRSLVGYSCVTEASDAPGFDPQTLPVDDVRLTIADTLNGAVDADAKRIALYAAAQRFRWRQAALELNPDLGLDEDDLAAARRVCCGSYLTQVLVDLKASAQTEAIDLAGRLNMVEFGPQIEATFTESGSPFLRTAMAALRRLS